MTAFPEVITFRVTSRCNNSCKYCYGPKKNLEEMSFLQLQKLFKLFYKNGVKAIVLTGGEPLIRKDFKNIIKKLKKYKFKIFLDTCGDLFFKYQNLILKNIDVIGLPVDFPNKSYRNSKNFKIILKILNFFKGKAKRPAVRIGTVVTRENIKKLERIGNLIKNYPINIWKIYEFIPQNVNAIKNRPLLEISPEQFDGAVQKIKNKFSKYFKVSISKRKGRTNAYFFIASDGTVFMPIDDFNICGKIKIGNIFDKDIVKKWKNFISKNNYFNNISATFNYRLTKN